MSILIHDPTIAGPLLEQRRQSGLDRLDEVWEGVYVMSPLADNEHQSLVTELASILASEIDWKGLGRTLAGANVSDRRDNWKQNFRIPDVLVFLRDTSAVDCGTHWFGGPEFGIEVVSPGDRTLNKLEFYNHVGTRELLIIDRDPWVLSLYRRSVTSHLEIAAVCPIDNPAEIISEIVPLRFSLEPTRSAIRISNRDGRLLRDIPIRSN